MRDNHLPIGAICCVTLLVGVMALSSASAEQPQSSWRLYAGPFQFSWKTEDGPRGHIRDCRTQQCNDEDFRRGNLDASIGMRVGAERGLWSAGRFHLAGGAEASLLFTEYNLSQHELRLLALDGLVAGRVDLGLPDILVRAGAGPLLSDDGRLGLNWFVEGGLELRLGPGAAIRAMARHSVYDRPAAGEVAVLLVAGDGPGDERSRWQAQTGLGVAMPGLVAGDDLRLKQSPSVELALYRRLRSSRTRLGVAVDATAWESEVRTVWIHTPGNERTENITNISVVVDHELGRGRGVRWRVGAGAKAGDWSDSKGGLLHRRDEGVEGRSWEAAVLARAEAVLSVPRPSPLVIGVEQAYWPSLELSELRIRLGIQISL
jgi:hypothetical protein